MADEAREWTDEELASLERRIRTLYEDAQASLTAQWYKYMAKQREALKTLYSAYLGASPEDKAAALEAYQRKVRWVTIMDRRYREMTREFAEKLANINQTAISYANGVIPQIYLRNFNYNPEGDAFWADLGVSYSIRSEHTLAHLIRDGSASLPQRALDVAKDVAWNMSAIDRSLTTGIMLGESIDKIADRILPIVGNNEVAAVRTARTMVTAAENQGRQDRGDELEAHGAVMVKIWIATPDARVRDWHLSMDGQEVENDALFTDGNGEKLMFPGDTSHGASGRTIYNCRCSTRRECVGVRMSNGQIMPIDRISHSGLHQQQIAEERGRRQDANIS